MRARQSNRATVRLIRRITRGIKRMTLAVTVAFVTLALIVTLDALVRNDQGVGTGFIAFFRTAPRQMGLFALAAATVLGIGLLLLQVRSSGRFVLGLFFMALILRLGWVVWVPTAPISDFEFMFNMAVKAAHGDFSFTEAPYYVRWTYQLPFTLYEALFVKLFGESTLPLKIMNAIWQSALAAIVYALGRTLFRDRAGRFGGLLYALYPSSISTVSVLSNQHPADFFFYAAIYLLVTLDRSLGDRGHSVRSSGWGPAVSAGLALAFGELFRPYGPVVIPLVAFYALFRAASIRCFAVSPEPGISASDMRHPDGALRRRFLRPLQVTAVVLIVFWSVVSAAGLVLRTSGVTHYSLKSHDPYWKFVAGLNPDTGGMYSEDDLRRIQKLPTLQAQLDAEKALVWERIRNTDALLPLFWRKFRILWGSPDAAFWWNHGVDRPALEIGFKAIERAAFLLVTAFAFVGIVSGLGRKARHDALPDGLWLLLWIMLGYAAAHLFIEIQVRYRYFVLPSLTLLAGAGLAEGWVRLRRRFTNGKILKRKAEGKEKSR